MILSKFKNIDKFLLFSLLTILIFPLFPTFFGNKSMHIIPISIIFSFIIIIKKQQKFVLKKSYNKLLMFFIISFVLLLMSLTNDVFNIREVGGGDFFGVLRPLYFLLFVVVGCSSVIEDDKLIKTLSVFFDISIVLGCILAVGELFFIEKVQSILYFLYKRSERIVLIDKATGWFGVTYYFAYFSTLLAYYAFFRFTKEKNFRYLLLYLCSFLTIILTQSRTIWISYFLGMILILFLRISFKNKSLYWIYAFIFLSICFLIFYNIEFIQENFAYAYAGISRLLDGGFDTFGSYQTSEGARLQQVLWAWNNNHFKVIGYGLARHGAIALESVYAFYLFRYGVFYLIVFIILLLYFFRVSSKLAIKYHGKNNEAYALFSGYSVFYLTSPISLIASASHEMIKIAFVFFIGMGFIYKLHKNNE